MVSHFKPNDGTLPIIDGQKGSPNNIVPVPRSLRLVTGRKTPGKTILLAYGSEPTRRVLASLMVGQGYCIICCGDGDAALRYLRSAPAQLIITGMVMPNMDGLELIRRLQSLHGNLPILALAEKADRMSHIYLRYAGLAGAAGTHTVPLRRERFLDAIGDILGGRPHAIRSAV